MTGWARRTAQMIAETALRLSPKGAKLYLTTTHYHAEHATGDGGFPAGTILIRPRVQQAELEAEGQKLIDLFSSRSAEDKELLHGCPLSQARHPVRQGLPAWTWAMCGCGWPGSGRPYQRR